MTNPDLTLIGVLVDRSGSMESCKDDMEGGINSFLKEQAAQPGTLEISLAQFDNVYEMLWKPTRITDLHVPRYNLVPRNSTALLDSMAKFINEIGQELRKRPQNRRPGNVIILVVTDGYENASVEYGVYRGGKAKIKTMVERQVNEYNWQFTYLGANQDAVLEGESMGFTMDSSLTYTTDNAPVAFAAASSNVSMLRSGLVDNISYSGSQRQDAVQP